ncbi:MAG: WecB/TagA/CpsF family glycosyltransferase [Candidatus Hydrogenedentes bacterium]|nr:WecB/TagA/CpsF family glycosyltransferase [Candidatus Hydrogenedentota bacterium]
MTDTSQNAPAAPRCAEDGLDTVKLFNMTINNVDLDEFLASLSGQIEAGTPGYAVTPNVDHVVEFDLNPEFREAYHDATYVLVDGTYILWAGRLFRKPFKQKLSGSDMIYWLSEYAAKKGYSIFLLGAEEGVADAAAQVLLAKYPGLTVAGTYSPPFGFEKDEASNNQVIERVRDSRADICFVALGSPKQDLWSWRHHRACGAKLCIGVGASIDFVAGRVKRAPVWMQRAGLEWVWRIIQEPVRMGKRYLVRDAHFLVLLWREFRGGTGT